MQICASLVVMWVCNGFASYLEEVGIMSFMAPPCVLFRTQHSAAARLFPCCRPFTAKPSLHESNVPYPPVSTPKQHFYAGVSYREILLFRLVVPEGPSMVALPPFLDQPWCHSSQSGNYNMGVMGLHAQHKSINIDVLP